MSEMNWEDNKVADKILQYVIDKSSTAVTSLKIPYQFFIPLLTALHDQLIGVTEMDIQQNCFKKDGELKTSIGSLKESNTENAPLCAIAYLSWEKEHRLFVARRVCPPTLHFLGHSYIPDGWGVVGKLAQELQQKYVTRGPDDWMNEFCIRSIKKSSTQNILPFKRDIETLGYNSVSVLPVFKQSSEGQKPLLKDTLLGVLVFFFYNDLPILPSRNWQTKLSIKVSKALAIHLETISGKQSIAKTWKDLKKTNHKIKIASLKLSDGDQVIRNSMQTLILEVLSRPDYYAVIDNDDDAILIAPREVDQNGQFNNREDVESVILRAVSQARLKVGLQETKEVTSELQWLSTPDR